MYFHYILFFQGLFNGKFTHELLIQRHGKMVNCVCGHNVDALQRAKDGVDLAKDIMCPFICRYVNQVTFNN